MERKMSTEEAEIDDLMHTNPGKLLWRTAERIDAEKERARLMLVPKPGESLPKERWKTA